MNQEELTQKTESKYSVLMDSFLSRAKNRKRQGFIFLGIANLIVIALLFILNQGFVEYSMSSVNIDEIKTKQVTLLNEIKSTSLDSSQIKLVKQFTSEVNQFTDKIQAEDKTKLFADLSTRILLGLIGFFLVQIFLKLYKYNIESSDYFYAISDSIKVLELENAEIKGIDFETLTKLFVPSNTKLETPESPKFFDFSDLIKGK